MNEWFAPPLIIFSCPVHTSSLPMTTVTKSNERTRLLVPEEERDHDQVTLHTSSSTTTVTDVPTPLQWRPLLVLLVLNAMQPLAFEVVFPFVNQMILEIGVVTDPERVGFYSGLIESIYSCMSFVAILPCSALADRIGRKPVILGGMLGLSISVVCFGMSKSFSAMVLSRCLGGALGGAWACARIVIGEMTDKSNQGVAFAANTIAYRTGQIIGLPLGGLLAHPERHFSFFRTPFWFAYPFALPCFVASALCLFAVIMGYFCLHETLGHKDGMITDDMTYGSVGSTTDVESSPPTPTRTSCEDDDLSKKVAEQKYKSIMTPSIISLLFSNVAMCMASETLFAVFPLFAFTPVSSGGLGMSEAAIGIQMGIRGVLHISIMGFFSFLQRRLGTVRAYKMSMWMWPVTTLFFPFLNLLARRGETGEWPFMIAFIVFILIWSVGGFGWTAIAIMVTDCAPSAEALAAINGMSQMATVLPQAIAPAFVTSLFATSIKSNIAEGNLIWIVLFVMTFVSALHSMTLREPGTDWRQK